MRFQKLLLVLLFFLVSTNVEASKLQRDHYWIYQTIERTQEQIWVSEKNLSVDFVAYILINDSIYNETDWLTFYFSPSYINYDVLAYNSEVKVFPFSFYETVPHSELPSEIIELKEKDSYMYNVSLKYLTPGHNYIVFKAHYVLSVNPYKFNGYEMYFDYLSPIETNLQETTFYLPYYLDIKQVTVPVDYEFSTKYRIVRISNENSDKKISFFLEDLNEKQKLEFLKEIVFLFVGALLGWWITKLDKINLSGVVKINNYKKHKKVIIKIFKK